MDAEPHAEPNMPLETLLPLRALVITLECLQRTSLPFFHQVPLTAFLRHLAGSPDHYDHYIRLDACETGRVDYRPGDYYRFLLLGLAGAEPVLHTLIANLDRLPASAPRLGQELPFRDNWRRSAIQDAFTKEPIAHVEDSSLYTMESLAQEVALWLGQTRFTWRWLSPARLLKEKGQREATRGEARYCRDTPDLDGPLLLRRLFESTNDLIHRRGAPKTPLPGAVVGIAAGFAHAFWIDHVYFNADGKQQVMGGMSGRLDLELSRPLSPAWWRLLLLGQYLGTGQRTAFGWGRYRLTTAEGALTMRRPLPAASLLQLAGREENLLTAWRHVLRNDLLASEPDEDGASGGEYRFSDGDQDDEPLAPPIERMRRDIERLLEGAYSIPELRGHLVEKPEGGVRPLAVPPLYDRVLQRAVGQILTPSIESLMYRRSHGYRPGRSRITARYDIQAAWRSGYRWIYESDIKDFFDSVDRGRLRDRLLGLYGEDPAVERVLEWLAAPVRYRGELIERRNGLPQGSPLSPLMANLMLDDFDSDMEQAGFHLVRFADDFIVLCKDPAEARAAGEAARASLAEHGLALSPEKTRITAMEDGFRYLGYLFVNDMALDVSGTREAKGGSGLPPENSWLARLGEREPQPLDRRGLDTLIQRLALRQPVDVGERDEQGTLLIVTGEPTVISTSNRRLRVHREDQLLYDLPLQDLQCVLLLGNHHLTTPAMAAALQNRVAVHIASGRGSYRGVLWNGLPEQGQELWLHQIATFADPEKAFSCAREVVAARLRHMKEALRQRELGHRLIHIDNAIATIHQIAAIDSLRGHEGRATREYFERLASAVPEEFGFDGRNRRPPRDPFNAMLSLGYTVLYGYTDSILRPVGLFPWAGFYHEPRGRHATLASDLAEPFRHVVERTALTLLLRREICPEDFSRTPAGACLMTDAARRKYLALLLERFEADVRARGETEADKLFTHLHRQALSLKNFIVTGQPFQAWRLR